MKQIMTRLTALLLALVMTTTLALAANKSGYSDVPDKNWASQSIVQCKQYNLLQGIGNGKFGLGQKMTRAAYAAALCRLTIRMRKSGIIAPLRPRARTTCSPATARPADRTTPSRVRRWPR